MHMLKPITRYMKNCIDRLQVKCRYNDKGCIEDIRLETLVTHEALCQYGKRNNCGFNPDEHDILKKQVNLQSEYIKLLESEVWKMNGNVNHCITNDTEHRFIVFKQEIRNIQKSHTCMSNQYAAFGHIRMRNILRDILGILCAMFLLVAFAISHLQSNMK